MHRNSTNLHKYSVKHLQIVGRTFPKGFSHKSVMLGENKEVLAELRFEAPSAINVKVRNDVPPSGMYLSWFDAAMNELASSAWPQIG